MLNEFKTFISRGNVIDLAVGVIIGAAFGAVTKSVVDDLLMPVIGLLVGQVDFANLFVTLSPGKLTGPASLNYGQFVNVTLNFLLVGAAVFLLVKAVNRMRAAPEPEAPPPTDEVLLLRDILDALKRPRA
jgi:large conductance mechanosensitive channel